MTKPLRTPEGGAGASLAPSLAAVAGDLDGEVGDIEAPHQADIDQGIFPHQAGARPAKEQQEHEHRDANPEEEAKEAWVRPPRPALRPMRLTGPGAYMMPMA